MNYFELFEIPVQLKVDPAPLHKKFFAMSRKYHPDYYVNDKPEVQTEMLQRSAALNKAYKTFQNPDETIKYVLREKGLLVEEEKYELPPDFLMKVLEINEQLMDEPDSKTAVGIGFAVDNLEKEIYDPVKEIVEHYKEGDTTEEELLRVKSYYYKKKYLDRIRQQLRGKT